MSPRIGRNTVASDALFATGVVALVGGISLLFAANFAHFSIRSAPGVNINLESLSWLGKAETKITQTKNPSVEVKGSSPERLVFQPLPQRKLSAGKKDSIRTSMAARRRALKSDSVVVSVFKAVPQAAPEAVTAAELNKFQTIHQILRSKFLAAVMVQPAQPVMLAVKVELEKPKKQARLAIQSKPAPKKVTIQTQAATEPKIVSKEKFSILEQEVAKLSSINPGPKTEQKEVLSAAATEKQQDSAPVPTHVAVAELVVQRQDIPSPRILTAAEAPRKPLQTGPPPEPVKIDKGLNPQADLERPAEARFVAPARPLVLAQANTQKRVELAKAQVPTRHEYSKKDEYPKVKRQPRQEPVEKSTDVIKYTLAAQLSAPVSKCVMALDWNQEVSLCDFKPLTNDRAAQASSAAGRWSVAQAKDHLPTLLWDSDIAPLLSLNDTLMLSRLNDTSVLYDSGIVFGKILAGWSVALSARSDRPAFLTMSRTIISAGEVDSDRYFVFLNVEPGAAVLHLSNIRTGDSAAVGIPVLNGVASFLNLTSVKYETIFGTVLDAEARKPKVQKGVTVSVIGQTATARTNAQGRFEINRVAVVGSHPIYLETRFKQTFPHRYKLSAERFVDAELFRFSDRQIEEWVDQVEGGVSPEGAMMIGAVPGLVAESRPEGLRPGIRVLLKEQTLPPEAYTLSPRGELLPDAVVKQGSPRFLGLQIPKGPIIVGLKDERGESVWSELLLVSPNIISVVGPY